MTEFINTSNWQITGKRVDLSKFREGWLVINHGKAHYFTRTNRGFRADCGQPFNPELRDAMGFMANEPGDFPRCKRCEG